MQSSSNWQWLLARLPVGINQIIVDGILETDGHTSGGIMLDDITFKPCVDFGKKIADKGWKNSPSKP